MSLCVFGALTALFVLASVVPTADGCPNSCACSVPAELHCTFRYLNTVPDHIQPAVERINLGYNSITVLKENEFSGLQNLEVLMLHSNTIHSIEDRAFLDLKSVQVLKMSYNKVKKINKETFKGLDSLLRLYIDHNHIDFINPEAFYGLTNLQLVHLEGNHLQQLHPDTFITLRHSQVFKVSSVRNIHLSDNLLTRLPADIFSGCTHLENVFLHGNPWICNCHMKWFPAWAQRNTGVLKCKRDKTDPRGHVCPVCQSPAPYHNKPVSLLPRSAFICTKPWIHPELKQKNISLDEGDFTPVSSQDFVAPLGSIQMNLTDHFHKHANLACTVQRPSTFENMTLILEEGSNNITLLTAAITTYLVCNVDYEHVHHLWQIVATYSDSPMKLKRGLMLTRVPEMTFRYSQMKLEDSEDGIYTDIEAEIKASPAWLMQEQVNFQLDRTTTTISTLHIKYQSVVNLRVENTPVKRDRYSWAMIIRDSQTETEYAVLTGGVVQLSCKILGDPKPLVEWILPDTTKVRAPFTSEDRRIIITAEGKLTLRGADTSDTGLYWCIATNYLDADVLSFRVTVLSPDVEEADVSGVQLTKPLGDNLLFDCGSMGSPKPSVQWILPDHTILQKSQGTRKVYENGTLFIQGLTERDRGFYRCLVANILGVDLLVSQVTVTGERLVKTSLDIDGSGMAMETAMDPNFPDITAFLSESPTSSVSDRVGQESWTIHSDRPYTKLRSQGRTSSVGHLGQRKRGSISNRRIWSTRIFDKAHRKVDPQKFAEFMKKAQDATKIKMETKTETVKYEDPQNDLSGDGDFVVGEDHNEENQSKWTETATASQGGLFASTEMDQTIGMETTARSHINFNRVMENTNIFKPESHIQSNPTKIKSTLIHYPKQISESQIDSVTPYMFTDNNFSPSFHRTNEVFSLDKKYKLSLNSPELSVMGTSQQLFSGEQHEDPETSTGMMFSFVTNPNIIPMKDGVGPVEVIVHTATDQESHTTFTAFTSTERQKDEVTFQTTQTINSARLPSGSTIVSQQQIRIIPKKNGRRGGRRRTFQGRRRIIKPSRITDIQSFISQVKQSPVKKESNTTVPYEIKMTRDCDCDQDGMKTAPTDSSLHKTEQRAFTRDTAATPSSYYITPNFNFRPEGSSDYITSIDGLGFDSVLDPYVTPNKEWPLSSTTITTTTSKVIRGRIPWNRLFGEGEKQKILERLSRPLSPAKISTTTETMTMNPQTSTAALPITYSPSASETVSTSQHTKSTESLFDDYGDLSSADFEFRTFGPSLYRQTTVSPYYLSRSSSTTETALESKTVLAPPIVKPPSMTNPDETLSSGSGGFPNIWPVVRQKPGRKKGRLGQRQRPFRRQRPLKKPSFTKLHSATTVDILTTEVVTSATPYKPMTSTMKDPHTVAQSRVSGHIRPPTWSNIHHTTPQPMIRRTRPTPPTSGGRKKGLNLSAVKVHTAEQGYPTTPTPYNNKTITGEETTRFHFGFEHSTKAMAKKPKIIGGNAASFTVLSNSDAFLPCEAVGNPKPTITWKQFSPSTGNAVVIEGKIGNFEVLSNGTLFIHNANMKYRGQYLCLAENNLGTDKLLVTLSVVAYPSRILEPKMRDIKSHAGNTVEMKCKAEGRPTPMISWILANRTQVSDYSKDNGRVSVTAEGTLIIDLVSVHDRGHYKCIASNPAGADTATVRLQVVASPPEIMEEKRQHVKVSVNQDLWLPCTGHGSPQPTVHWVLYDGTVMQFNRSTSDIRVSVYENGTLHIQDLALNDNGIYECIATSSTGSERRVVTLTVQRQQSVPQIVETSQQLTELFYGDQLRLNCLATGEPQPRIIWRLPSKAVVDQWHRMGSRIQVLDNGTLIINTVIDKDAGDYLCVARSKIGEDLQLMKITVSMKPAKIEPKIYGKKQVTYGNDLKVDCEASGAPKPEISWGLPDGTLVNSALQSDSSGRGRARRYTLFDNGTLYVNQVGMSEEGDYTCYAQNQVGKDEMHVHITVVTAAPRIHSPSQTAIKVKLGGKIRFDCEAIGEPKPKILWLLPTQDVIAASNEHYLMHVNGSLDIRDVKLSDAGEYICIARNPAGENRKAYKLEIDGNPPVINGNYKNGTVIRDVAAKYSRKFINCNAKGDPPITITWIMPHHIFLTAPYFGSRINVHHNGTLEIRNVRPTDQAEFICLARNDAGEAVMVVQLQVTSMLRRPIFKNPYNVRIVSQIGKTTVLNCSADGYPVPEIFWTLPNGTRIAGGSDHDSRYRQGSDGTLIISNPHKEDAGKYRCGAKNLMGYIEKLIVLELGQKPYILTRPRGIIRSMSGQPLFLHCLTDGNPRPRIYWTVPGGHTLSWPQVLGRYHLLENGTLIVQDTTLHDQGNYICRARNVAGEARLTVPVVIIAYPPQITTGPPPNVRALAGAPIQLNCVATGIPKPDITWELPDHSVLSTTDKGRHMGSELLHPQGTLIIQRPTALDSGAYKCLAKNYLGIDSKVTYVYVL
ncbi:immunoglobulin superfamily member 10 [Thalassophryne amazonica]|uniref:immunoglobulin superfamily member 10 n=1 Tax=Thalassophryne amazonica TaxID=390379 RepID=UPI001470F548|nr:immunoglobulin superfamily member 10 [Thalassophryne amazonica]